MRSPQSTATMRGRSGFVHGRFVGAAAIAFAVLYVTLGALAVVWGRHACRRASPDAGFGQPIVAPDRFGLPFATQCRKRTRSISPRVSC